MDTIIEDFIVEIEGFRHRHGMSATAFGKACVNDGHFLLDLLAGGDIKVGKIRRVRRFMREFEGDRSKPRMVRASAWRSEV